MRDRGERAAVIFYGIAFGTGTLFFSAVWEYARLGRRMLGPTIDFVRARTVSQRFWVGPALVVLGTLVGALVPALGQVVFGAIIIIFWLPIKAAEPTSTAAWRGRGDQVDDEREV